MNDKILPRVFALFALIFLVVAGMAFHAIRAVNRSVASSDWVNHTYATIYELENIISRLRQGDGLMRTYALTGEAGDLAASREAFVRMGQHFETAAALTRGDPGTQQTLLQFKVRAEEREALAQTVEAARKANRIPELQSLLAADAGSAAVQAIELGLSKLRNAQFELLSERDHQAYLQAQTTRWVVGVGIGLNFVLLGGVGWLMRDDIAARRRAAAALVEANAQLETKVQARTVELEQANRALRAESLERQWTITSQEHQIRYNQLIVNSVNDLVFVLTRAMTVTRINPAVVRLTGRTDETILTGPLAGIVVVDNDPATGLDPLHRAIEEGRELRQQPAVVLGPAGQRIPARLNLIPLRDQDKVVGAIVVVQVQAAARFTPENKDTA